MTTTTETNVQRYDRLADEYCRLRSTRPDERTPEHASRADELRAELAELLSVPPAGYAVPKAVTDLMTFATSYGWLASAHWTPPGYEGEPYLRVQVGRLVRDDERDDFRGYRWLYELTWHSRDCAPGKVKRFGQGTATTPDNPATRPAPSVKAIREVIAAHPDVPQEAADLAG